MKKRLFISILASLALIFCLSACNKVIEIQPGVPTGSFAENPTGTPSGDPSATSSGAAGDSDKLTEVVVDMAKEDLLPAFTPSEEIDPELAKEYAEQYPTVGSARAGLLEIYLDLVTVTPESSTANTAVVVFDTPDLAAILMDAVEQAGEDAATSDIENAMTDVLLSGEYPTRSQTCTLPLSRDREDNPVLEKTPEYWDAVYGGLISLSKELLEGFGG